MNFHLNFTNTCFDEVWCTIFILMFHIKFSFSNKATKFETIFQFYSTSRSNIKTNWNLFQIFVAFLECTYFNDSESINLVTYLSIEIKDICLICNQKASPADLVLCVWLYGLPWLQIFVYHARHLHQIHWSKLLCGMYGFTAKSSVTTFDYHVSY